MISTRKVCVTSDSKKHKVDTTISTISEVVLLHEAFPQVLWTEYFLHNQCFEVIKSTLYQDSMSAILLERNGRASSLISTKHIDIRHFFIQDRFKKGDIGLEYCHTNTTVDDFMTRPL